MIGCIRVLSIVAVALYLVPTGAHLLELPNKMALSAPDYMVVQRIYSGWALLGIVLFVAMALTLLLAIVRWRHRVVAGLSLVSFLSLVGTQILFWTYTQPMNRLSNNWTVTPEPFEMARQSWEYSHAVSAALTFLALLAIVAAVVRDTAAR